jgi:putative transport protein
MQADYLANVVRLHPELAMFATIVVGHFIGRLQVRKISLGTVVGTLIAGMIIGLYTGPEIPDLLKWAFFDLFLFAVGYSAGPQFFASLRREALPQMLLAVVVACTGLAAAVAMVAIFHFDAGLAAGLVSGALTQSAALGSALNAIASMNLAEDARAVLSAHAPLADATTYIFGEIGLILFVTVVAPRLLKVDLGTIARDAERALEKTPDDGGLFTRQTYLALRAYRIDNPDLFNLRAAEFEDRFASGRLIVASLRRRGGIIRDVPADYVLLAGDVVALASRRPGMVAAATQVGEELDDPDLLAVPLMQASIVVVRPDVVNRSLSELGRKAGRGLFLNALTRGETHMPRALGVRIQRGDVFHLTGSPTAIAAAARAWGYIERDPGRTDLVYLAGGVVLGVLLGLVQISVTGVPLGLGSSGGVLVIGLVAGWLHSRFRVIGHIPESALRLLSDVGLIVFVAAIGLAAGPHAMQAIDEGGVALFARLIGAGVVVTMAGPIVGLAVGHFVLKMPPHALLPGIAGAQTTVATLNALKERGGSDVFAIGFTVPFAVSNVLITLWGPLIVAVAFAVSP